MFDRNPAWLFIIIAVISWSTAFFFSQSEVLLEKRLPISSLQNPFSFSTNSSALLILTLEHPLKKAGDWSSLDINLKDQSGESVYISESNFYVDEKVLIAGTKRHEKIRDTQYIMIQKAGSYFLTFSLEYNEEFLNADQIPPIDVSIARVKGSSIPNFLLGSFSFCIGILILGKRSLKNSHV